MRKAVIVGGVVVLAGVSAALYSRSISHKDKDYKTVAVTRGPVVEKALAVGAIRPKREVAVKSKISGIVKTSFREVGVKVKAGDPLFEIIPDPTPMELTEARREVEIAQNTYDQAKKLSRHPQKFGTGIPEGIIASEAANNANVAGSLVTIMAFGIPGDAVTAEMLGAMIIHGIQPGPLFMTQEPRVAYGIFAAYLLAHPVMMVLQWLLSRVYLRLVQVPKSALIPVILVLCVVGAYALNNTMDNVWVLLLFGVVGYLLVKFRFPLAPLILGVILGDQIEVNLVRSLMTDADPWLFLTRPISGTLLLLSALSVVLALWQHRRTHRRGIAPQPPEPDF